MGVWLPKEGPLDGDFYPWTVADGFGAHDGSGIGEIPLGVLYYRDCWLRRGSVTLRSSGTVRVKSPGFVEKRVQDIRGYPQGSSTQGILLPLRVGFASGFGTSDW